LARLIKNQSILPTFKFPMNSIFSFLTNHNPKKMSITPIVCSRTECTNIPYTYNIDLFDVKLLK